MPELTEIKGVGPVLAKACADNGYDKVEQIAAAMLHDLVAVPGISEARAKLVIAAAQELLEDGLAPAKAATPPEAEAEPVSAENGETTKPKKKKDKKKKEKKKGKKDKKKKKKKSKKGKKS